MLYMVPLTCDINLNSVLKSIFLDEMVQLTNTVFAKSTNISTNIETAVPISLSVVQERTKDHFQITFS